MIGFATRPAIGAREVVVTALLLIVPAVFAAADDEIDWKARSRDDAFWTELAARPGAAEAGAVIVFHEADTEVQILEGRFALVTEETIVEAILDPNGPGVQTRWEFPETHERRIRDLEGRIYVGGNESELEGDYVQDVKPFKDRDLYDGVTTKVLTFPDPQPGSLLKVKRKIVAGGGKGSVSWGGLGSFDRPGSVTGGPGGGAYVLHVHHFNASIPVEMSRYTVVFPAELASGALAQRWVTWGKAPEPTTERFYSPDGERVRVRWEGGPRPAVPSEPLMPPWNDALSYVALSPSGVTWPELASVYYQEYLTHAVTVDRTLEGTVKEVVGSIQEPRARARAIFEYVSDKIDFVDVPLFDNDLEPHAAREVMEAGHGDGRDQTMLLVALLRGAGLTADPAAVRTNPRGHLEEGLVTFCQFDHMIASVVLEGERIWLDPSEPGLPFGELPAKDQGAHALLIAEGRGEMVELPEARRGAGTVTRVFDGTLSPDGALDGRFMVEVTGIALPRLDFLRAASPDLSTLLAVGPGASWKEPKVTVDEGTLRLEAHLSLAPGTVAADGDSLSLQLFFPKLVFFPEPLPEGSRVNPIQWSASVTEMDSIVVELTGGLTWPEGTRRKAIGAPMGRCSLRAALEGSKIVAIREIDLRRGEWPAGGYDRLRDFTVRVPEESAKPLLLGKP